MENTTDWPKTMREYRAMYGKTQPRRMRALEQGHTLRCSARLVYGDGVCECSKDKESCDVCGSRENGHYVTCPLWVKA